MCKMHLKGWNCCSPGSPKAVSPAASPKFLSDSPNRPRFLTPRLQARQQAQQCFSLPHLKEGNKRKLSFNELKCYKSQDYAGTKNKHASKKQKLIKKKH